MNFSYGCATTTERRIVPEERGNMIRALLRLSAGVLAVALACACTNSPTRAVSTQAPPPGRLSDGGASQADVDGAMRKRGYKPALYRGERVYCRNEMITGSNLQTKVCMTARQIEDQERSGKDMLTGPHPDGCGPETKGCM